MSSTNQTLRASCALARNRGPVRELIRLVELSQSMGSGPAVRAAGDCTDSFGDSPEIVSDLGDR